MALLHIGSSHPQVRTVSAARRGIGSRAPGLICLEGSWAHERALRAGGAIQTSLWCPELSRSDRERACAEQVHSVAANSYEVSARTMSRLGSEEALICTVRLPRWQPQQMRFGPSALLLVADGIEYAGNLGSLIRTVNACGADCLVLTNSRARRTHPKVFGASRGTVLTTPVVEFADVAGARDWLRRMQVTLYLAAPGAPLNYRDCAYGPGRVGVVVGSEGQGIGREWFGDAQVVSIPMLGDADSLNVATSAGILLYEVRARTGGYADSSQN